jgi:hypothetical protein
VDYKLPWNIGMPEDALIISAHCNASFFEYRNPDWHSIFLSSLNDINPISADFYDLYVKYLSVKILLL